MESSLRSAGIVERIRRFELDAGVIYPDGVDTAGLTVTPLYEERQVLIAGAELLASQQYSVQEVAEMVGFNDTATFRKRFTEQYGVTPSQYGIPA